MTASMTIDVLPASRGDCLWIECRRPGRPWRLLVDGGMPAAWPSLRRRIEALPAKDRVFDLAVVTHIDSDHIGGILPLLGDHQLGVRFGDVWFNGLPMLPGGGQTRSVAEGESLVHLLSGAGAAPAPPWNLAFGGSAVMTGGDAEVRAVDRDGWPAITLLSPSPKRLGKLRNVWEAELARLRRGEPAEPPRPLEAPAPLDDLEALAATRTSQDQSVPNGSSIAFLLEHEGASCLLTGDAFVSVLGAALTTLANDRGGEPVAIDVFKLSHHGSKGNVIPSLLALAPARHYVVSTNGERFRHPDDVALARVVTTGPTGLTLWFNYPTDATLRWNDAQLKRRYGFHAAYSTADAGVRLELGGRERG
jgi:hypothetical protein